MLGLLQSQAFRRGPLHPLTPCQINEHKPRLHVFNLVVVSPSLILTSLVNIDMQNGVTSARSFVHLLAGHCSVSHSSIDDVYGLLNCLDGDLHELFNKDFSVVFLTDLEVLALIGIQQVLDLVLINLIETQMDMPL